MRLTNVEKYAIQGMVGDGKNAKQIAKVIGKEEAIITKYVSNVAKSIVKIEEAKLACLPDGDHTDSETWTDAPSNRPTAKNTAPVKITPEEEALEKFKQEEEQFNNRDAVAQDEKLNATQIKEAAIIGRRTAKSHMINRTAGGAKGIKIMTASASAIAEERAKNYDNSGSRMGRGAIFDIEKGEVIGKNPNAKE